MINEQSDQQSADQSETRYSWPDVDQRVMIFSHVAERTIDKWADFFEAAGGRVAEWTVRTFAAAAAFMGTVANLVLEYQQYY